MQERAAANPNSDSSGTRSTRYLGEHVLEAVGLKNLVTGAESVMPVGGVFMAIGHHPNTEFLNGAIELNSHGYILTRDNVETSMEGVFAAGDVHDNHYRQAITAAGTGSVAALDAEHYLAALDHEAATTQEASRVGRRRGADRGRLTRRRPRPTRAPGTSVGAVVFTDQEPAEPPDLRGQTQRRGTTVANIAAVTDAEFETQVLKSDKPVLVDFWAEWCGPCRQVSPILDEIASTHGDKITFLKMNVDENPVTPSSYRVTGIPTINVYQGGEVVKSIVGARPKAALLNELSDYIA